MAPLRIPPNFPVELKERILFYLYAEDPRCVFEVFCPEWKMCSREGKDSASSVRFDMYSLPKGGEEEGRVKARTAFGGCCGQDGEGHRSCLCLPYFWRDPRGFDSEGRWPGGYKRELMREWVDEGLVVVSHARKEERLEGIKRHDSLKGITGKGEGTGIGLLRGEGVGRLVPGEGWSGLVEAMPGGVGKEYLCERIRWLCINTFPRLLKIAPLDAADPENGETIRAIGERLEEEWRDTYALDWGRMKRLRGLWVDLRIWEVVNRGRREEDGFFRRVASKLVEGLKGKGLEVLVIAGLGGFKEEEGEAKWADVEEGGKWDEESGLWRFERGRIDWFRSFKEAVRPGGKVIFVNMVGEVLEW